MRFSTQDKIVKSCDINSSRRVFFPETDPLRELSFDEIQLFEIRKNMKNVKSGNLPKDNKKKLFKFKLALLHAKQNPGEL